MKFIKLFLLISLSIIQFNAFGQIVLTLDNIPSDIQCSDIWTEENVELRFLETTSSDCNAGGCFFGMDLNAAWLYPSRMTVNLSGLQNITLIEMDVIDDCSINCTRAFLTDVNGMTFTNTGNLSGSLETLSLFNPMGEPLSELAISSCEGRVTEIRLFQNVVNSVPTPSDSPLTTYPNPSSVTDNVHFKTTNDAKWSSLERIDIYDSNGMQVCSKEMNGLESINELFIPAVELPRGIFFVQFKLDNQFFREKIIRL